MQQIVVVEQNAMMRSLLAEWLQAEGYVVECADGQASLHARHPDLAIVDVHPPRAVAVEAIRTLQRAYPGVPIIAISGSFRSGVRADGAMACALGAQRVMAKPFTRQDLVAAVRATLHDPACLSPGA